MAEILVLAGFLMIYAMEEIMHFVLVKFAHLGKSEQILVVTCNNEGFLQRMITQGSQTTSRCTMVTHMTTSLYRQRRDFRWHQYQKTQYFVAPTDSMTPILML